MSCSVCRTMSDEIVIIRRELKRLRDENERLKARLVETSVTPPPFKGERLNVTLGELVVKSPVRC
jgi:hypothetical protein